MDKIRFNCPKCGKKLAVSPDKAGKTGKCPACGERFRIPSVQAATIPAPQKVKRGDDEMKCVRCKFRLPKNVCGYAGGPLYGKKVNPTEDSCDYFRGDDDTKCVRCKHRLPKNVCGYAGGPLYGKKVNPTEDSCDYFTRSAALDLAAAALTERFITPRSHANIAEMCKTALRLGLPEDRAVLTRTLFADCLLSMAQKQSPDDWLGSPITEEAVVHFEEAASLDARGRYEEMESWPWLYRFDACYVLTVLKRIRITQGLDAAISYLEEKVRLFDYMRVNPMLGCLVELAESYLDKTPPDEEGARTCAEAVVRADPGDSGQLRGHQAETIKRARELLGALESSTTPLPEQQSQEAKQASTSQADFSFRRDFKRIRWRETLSLNMMRAAGAGSVWCVVFYAIFGSMPDISLPRWFPLLYPFVLPMVYLLFVFPIGLVADYLLDPGHDWPLWVNVIVLVWVLSFIWGDPLVFLLHKACPRAVPVDRFPPFYFRWTMYLYH